MPLCRHKGLGYLPVGLFFMLVVTVVTSYTIAVLRDDVAVVFPYISDTGAKPPESCIFGQLVNLSSLLLLVLIYVRYKELNAIQGLPPPQVGRLNNVTLVLGILCTFGLSLVGNFQDTNVLVVHEIGALTLFACGTVYCMMQTRITYLLYPEYTRLFLCGVRLLLSVVMLIAMLASISLEVVAHIERNNATDTHAQWKPSDGGFAAHILSASFEWVLVGAFGLFSLTFFSEFCKVSLTLNMFLHVEPLPVQRENDLDSNEYSRLLYK